MYMYMYDHTWNDHSPPPPTCLHTHTHTHMHSVCHMCTYMYIYTYSIQTQYMCLFPVQLKAECPKPPLSAYMLFCRAKRQKVHQKHPKMSAKEVTVKLSKKWKSMGEEDKVQLNVW